MLPQDAPLPASWHSCDATHTGQPPARLTWRHTWGAQRPPGWHSLIQQPQDSLPPQRALPWMQTWGAPPLPGSAPAAGSGAASPADTARSRPRPSGLQTCHRRSAHALEGPACKASHTLHAHSGHQCQPTELQLVSRVHVLQFKPGA